jgi:galactofuranosylgalactofuranosylrhamnosyl-N-acetylglucosaminyl-diphospho-decaprenol beta-1,5/1,6-galactofuranosyltransferase
VNTLQSLVFPNLDVQAPDDLYVRLNASAWPEMKSPRIHFEAGGLASMDTFFNGLTVGTWKRYCDIRSLVLRLQGSGEFVLTLGLHRQGVATVWLSEHSVSLAPGQAVHTPLRAWDELKTGMLFFRLRAIGPGVLESAAYVTPDEPHNAVRLGMVITHFNRQPQVLPAIERITRSLLDRPDLQGRMTLTVIDNSRNLPAIVHPAVEVVPNRNLGGTGGFVRGLLSLMDGGRHTHALFMDDDASCETESIARSFALLQYSQMQRLSVAGALLREAAPWHLLEKGARFDGKVQPLCPGLDVRRVDDLLEAERPVARPDYGAWWFFAFPIGEVRQFPFPFFVRGDDVFFGLRNAFHITTLNGVACMGEDFGAKHSPMTAYLDARYHLVLALIAERKTASRVFWIGSRLFLKALTSYHYTSARAVTLAMRHTLQGPEFFRDNLDLQAVRNEIASWTPSEKMVPLDRALYQVRGARKGRESTLRRLLRVLTLQGFLLPDSLLMNRMTLQDKAFHGKASQVFRYRKVLYEHAASGTGYIAEYDRARFFSEVRAFVPAWTSLFRHLGTLRRRYAAGVEQMASLAFWRGVYGGAPGSADPAGTPTPAPPSAAARATADAPQRSSVG